MEHLACTLLCLWEIGYSLALNLTHLNEHGEFDREIHCKRTRSVTKGFPSHRAVLLQRNEWRSAENSLLFSTWQRALPTGFV